MGFSDSTTSVGNGDLTTVVALLALLWICVEFGRLLIKCRAANATSGWLKYPQENLSANITGSTLKTANFLNPDVRPQP